MKILVKITTMLLLVLPLYAQEGASSISENTQQQNNTQNQQPLTPQQKNLQRLYEKNPFGVSTNTANVQQIDNVASPQGLELRSIYCVNNKWHFSIRDSAQEKSYTLRLGEPYSEAIPYAVDFFDEETNSVSLTSPIGSYTLVLKERDELTGKPVVGTSAKSKNSKTKANVKTTRARR
ncbi:MAG: hypothetical protein J6B07_03800 [Opitutales bacterium]|nr:hypothetical protein [Opitutales bacterium]